MKTLLDELREGAPSPTAAVREVPAPVRWRILLGGRLHQFGWLFFGFGMIFFWGFVCHADLTSWYRFRAPLAIAQGTVTGSKDTGASEGGSKYHRGTPIYRNDFEFMVDDYEYRNASYAVGTELRKNHLVEVEYVAGKPQFARIRGMRTNVFGPVVLLAIVLPLIGLGLIGLCLAQGFRACDLLARGLSSTARLLSQEPTNTKTYGRTVYKFTFSFQTSAGATQSLIINTERAERFQNPAAEAVLYDPSNPKSAVILDNLPGKPHLDDAGGISLEQPGISYLVLPLATLIGHGFWAIHLLLKS